MRWDEHKYWQSSLYHNHYLLVIFFRCRRMKQQRQHLLLAVSTQWTKLGKPFSFVILFLYIDYLRSMFPMASACHFQASYSFFFWKPQNKNNLPKMFSQRNDSKMYNNYHYKQHFAAGQESQSIIMIIHWSVNEIVQDVHKLYIYMHTQIILQKWKIRIIK